MERQRFPKESEEIHSLYLPDKKTKTKDLF